MVKFKLMLFHIEEKVGLQYNLWPLWTCG